MEIRLVHCGNRKIAVIKAIRSAYGNTLKDAKHQADQAPITLPGLDYDYGARFVQELREAGASVEATGEPNVLDKITAASYIQTASIALGEGNMKDARISLRAALRLLGDYPGLSEMNFRAEPH